MIAYIALLIQFINLLLRVFHGKQNHGRIVGGFLSGAWDTIRYTIHAVVSFVVAIWKALLSLYAGIFIHSSLKLIGAKVYFLYCRIMEIDDLTSLLWDRACDAVAVTLAVALIVWTVYWFSYFIYVPLRFLFPWLLLLKRKLVGRGRIRWKPERMLLKNRYVGDAPPVPTGVAAPRSLRIPRYTRVIPLLNDQQLAAALLEFGWKQDRYIREYRTDPRYDHWRGWVRTPAAIETAKVVAAVDEPIADAPPVPTGVTAPRCLRIPRYTRVIPVLNDQQLAAALLEFDWKQDRYIREYRTDPRYDHWRGWVRTPAVMEPAEALADPVETRVRWKPDRVMTQDFHVGDIPPVPTRVPAKRVLRRARYTRVIPVLNDEQLAVAMLEFDAGQEESIHCWDSDLSCDHWRGWVRTLAAIGPADATDNNPIADDASEILDMEPAEDTDNNLNAVEEAVPDVVEEPWEALNEPTVDDAPDDAEVGVLVAAVEEPVVEAVGHPAVAIDDAPVDAEVGVPVADVEEPAVADATDDPVIAVHDEEVVLGAVAEEPDDTFDVHDMAADNNPVAEEDAVPDAVLVRNKEKQAHTGQLRRSPRLRQAAGSVFLSSNTGRVVRRSARIMSRR